MHGDLESISVGPQPSAVTDGTRREGAGWGSVGRSARIYVFGEGQGNEGSDKCSKRAEDSWMQRVERKPKPEGGEGRDRCTCASRARYRDEFHSPDRFRREDATRTVLEPGIRGIPNSRRPWRAQNPMDSPL